MEAKSGYIAGYHNAERCKSGPKLQTCSKSRDTGVHSNSSPKWPDLYLPHSAVRGNRLERCYKKELCHVRPYTGFLLAPSAGI
jgi:hypothetical protein